MAAVSRPCEGRKHRSTAAEYGCDFSGETADPETDALGRKRRALVRPVHTVTLLLGDKVIPATILGIQSDRVIAATAYGRAGIHHR